jgi:hypothetical protein
MALACLAGVRRRSSAANALVVGSLWLLLLVAAPAAAGLLIDSIHTPPARTELVSRTRRTHADAISRTTDLLAQYGRQHLLHNPHAGTYIDRAFQEYVIALDATARHTAPLWEQLESEDLYHIALTNRIGWLLPPIALQSALEIIAGTDERRHAQFGAQTRIFWTRLRSALMRPMFETRPITADEYGQLPRFRFDEPADRQRLRRDLIPPGLSLTLAAAMVAAVAWLKLGTTGI